MDIYSKFYAIKTNPRLPRNYSISYSGRSYTISVSLRSGLVSFTLKTAKSIRHMRNAMPCNNTLNPFFGYTVKAFVQEDTQGKVGLAHVRSCFFWVVVTHFSVFG